jgi:exopolysaccharide biosynthesis protein
MVILNYMRKLLLILSILLLSESLVFSQDDSIVYSNAKWKNKRVAAKITFRSIHFEHNELFNSNQSINIAEISPASRKLRMMVVYSDSLELTSQMAKKSNALAAINGSFFKMRGADPDVNQSLSAVPRLERSFIGKNRSQVYLRYRDSLISENVYANRKRQRSQAGAVAIHDNEMFVLKADTSLSWEHGIKAQYVMSTGPMLLVAGRKETVTDDAFCTTRHPRTAIGKKADGTVIFIVVDGRSSSAMGMSIKELQKIMAWTGCVDAINLDGGGSSTMYIKNEPFNGVVNYPSDNKKFDHLGEREVANALLVIKR